MFNDCQLRPLKYPLVFFWVFHPLLEFQRFCIGLEIDSTAGVFLPFQYSGSRFGSPLVKIFRHDLPFSLCAIGRDGQYLVRCQDFCNLHGAFAYNTQAEDSLYYLCSFFIHNPFLFVRGIFDISIMRITGNMFPSFAVHFYDRTDFLAGVLCIIIVLNILEYCLNLFCHSCRLSPFLTERMFNVITAGLPSPCFLRTIKLFLSSS